ncbi:GNAT family N-acetyltransferase [Novosphingobium sp. SG707]|uniref:GNAT family N-acetyltransferase n=1 Tax=Novosphingobium sp. SG707 TaxID=2586996 RepID=UPI0014480D8D|nr:GNAT family N-acetyltransferase [Novosphingobium sp. SG707]NKJ03001.1 ribosomal protein S18 acetylase RimI-like enzyme [Novosphingobium sp. SG707]
MNEAIRIATLVDADAVTTVTRAAYAKWVPVIGREPLPMKADHAAHIRDHRADLLLVGNEVAALVEIIQRHDDLMIENVAVAPAFQKRGYGRKMVAHAERLAAEAGFEAVRLYTNAKFEENICLYKSLGYDIEREEAITDGILVHMVKAI